MIIPKFEDFNSSNCTERSIKLHYPDFYKYIIEHYDCELWSEKLYWYYKGLKEYPKCPMCGKLTKFQNLKQGYREFCSNKCLGKSSDIKSRRKQSIQKRYGVDNVFKSDVVKEKIKQTNRGNLGVDYPMQSKIVKEKSKQTCLDKYGVDHNSKAEVVKNKKLLKMETSIKKMRKTMKANFIKKNKSIIDIDELTFTYKCPHNNCNKCKEKYYVVPKTIYYSRKILNIEPCTTLKPVSSNRNTTIEIFIKLILDQYEIEYKTNDRSAIKPLELDIYIPSKKLAIECNGVYWHNINNNLTKEYHYNKFIKCQEQGIQLISIWEDQVINNPEKVKSIILSKLGIYEERIYARNCIIKEVSSKECNEFLEKYHLQGKTNSSIRLGLYYNNELISVMTFGRGRKCLNSKIRYELYRYCCKEGIQVVGGASRLFKHFLKEYNPNSIESFSSNDISNGNLYQQLGFEKVSDSIGYWYVDKEMNRYHRYKFTKYSLVNEGYDKDKTEYEIMNERGFYRIYDSGQTKWRYENTKI